MTTPHGPHVEQPQPPIFHFVLEAGQPSGTFRFSYTNWEGKTANRTIQPVGLYWGHTSYHPEDQWILVAWDMDKKAIRHFALKDMKAPLPNPGED
jgi:predicted DNA-binding transcriptional regulator YafY